ncbi:MAG: urease accessory protein UreF [Granulosicoccus sp.]
MLSHLRLLQLLSPMLPVGSYSYSQGLEWAVEQQWVSSKSDFEQWLVELIAGQLAQQDLPLLRRLFVACSEGDISKFDHWSHMSLALRDTTELRAEERARADAYLRILNALPEPLDARYLNGIKTTPLAAIAWAAVQWEIEDHALLAAYAHNWLEAYTTNGVKIIPLGQSDGQALIHALIPALCSAVDVACAIDDDAVGFSSPAIALASCGHESQYTRLYRS